jgi:carbon storage regulator CsrA
MLVIARKVGESITLRLGDTEVNVILGESTGGRTKIAIDAPKSVRVFRSEVAETQKLNIEASTPKLPEGFIDKLIIK